MLEEIKIGTEYFDTDYRIFYEDLDIAWRAQNLGWKAYYMPKAIAYHVRGGTVRESSGRNQPYARHFLNQDLHLDLIKNRYLTIIKNESFLSSILHLPFILFYDFLAWGYIIFFRLTLIKMFFAAPYFLKSGFIKRKIIHQQRRQIILNRIS